MACIWGLADTIRGTVVTSSPGVASQFQGAEGGEDALTIYSQLMNKIFNGAHGGIDLESLVIIPRQQCWVLYVDALVGFLCTTLSVTFGTGQANNGPCFTIQILEYNGNVLDSVFLATRGALSTTQIPKVKVEQIGEGEFDFDVIDGTVPVKAADVPITVTLNKLGKRYIVDPNPLEELSSTAKVTVAVNPKGNICTIQKTGRGGIDPSLLSEMIQSARTIGTSLIKALDEGLKKEKPAVYGIGRELFR